MSELHTPEIKIFENVNDLYYQLLSDFRLSTLEFDSPTIALPTGNTMIPFYRLLSATVGTLPVPSWNCVALDEYYPLTEDTEEFSFQKFLEDHFFSKIKLNPRQKIYFNAYNPSAEDACETLETTLQNLGGIDLALLGLGRNGHIAFNEPGTPFQSRTHVAELLPDTLYANFQDTSPPFTKALTLGIRNFLEAKHVKVVAIGKSKSEAIQRALRAQPSPSCPASALRYHPRVTWYLDKEAAQFLSDVRS